MTEDHDELMRANSLPDRIDKNNPGPVFYEYSIAGFSSDDGYSTGVALRNGSKYSANVFSTFYSESGDIICVSGEELPGYGQMAFLPEADGQGWGYVQSDQPLLGIAFKSNLYMADIPFAKKLAKNLIIPHVAQNEFWDTVVYIANPNNALTTVTLEFVHSNGRSLYTKMFQISPFGAGKFALNDLVEQSNQNSGSLEIEASNGVVAFAIYDDLKIGRQYYAGIVAVPAP